MNDLLVNSNKVIQVQQFKNELFESFIKYADVKETTLKGYLVCLKRFSYWLQDNDIKQPVREDIKAYKQYLDQQGYTAGTKAQYLRAVKQFFKWTSCEGLYPNIADNIKGAKVRQDNTRKMAFDETDIKNILNSIDRSVEAGKRDYLMILLSVTCGLRIIEMQRANINDIQTIQGQKVLYIQGKGHDEKDDFKKLVPEVIEAVENYLNARPGFNKNSPLFVGAGNRERGDRLTEPSISRIIKNRFKNAGYDCNKLTAHSLRHTSNTLLFKSGADLYTVQQHARHSDPKTTEIYIHELDKMNDRSEQKIYDQIFNPGNKAPEKEAIEILKGLSPSLQAEALEMLKSLKNKQEFKETDLNRCSEKHINHIVN